MEIRFRMMASFSGEGTWGTRDPINGFSQPMFQADDQRSRKGRSRLVYTAATAGRRRSRQATAAAIAPSGGASVLIQIRDLAAGSGALGQEADTCPVDRDSDISGIRALESSRARRCPSAQRGVALYP
jgi:hypothetical protein